MRSIIALVTAAAALTACAPVGPGGDSNLATPPPPAPGTAVPADSPTATATPEPLTTEPLLPAPDHQITYRIGGSATKALITYSTPSGQEQQNGAHVPWKHRFKVKDGDFVSLIVSAQNSGGGTITCEIDVDGKKVKAAKSSGAYAIASCDYPLGF